MDTRHVGAFMAVGLTLSLVACSPAAAQVARADADELAVRETVDGFRIYRREGDAEEMTIANAHGLIAADYPYLG